MSKHLKRLKAPRTLKLHRKEKKWTIKAMPGPHRLDKSITLGLIIRDYLHLCDTYKEAKRIVSNGEILVDGAKRKDIKFPCGLMDVISIPKLKKDYRVLYDKRGKLVLTEIPSENAEWKLCRVENKTILNGNRVQLNLHDGKNILVKKDEYKTGDVLKISLPDKKITDIYPFDKGTIAMIIGGSHSGQIANILDIEITPSPKPNITKMKSDVEFLTIKDYVFPIGKDKPVISLPEVKVE